MLLKFSYKAADEFVKSILFSNLIYLYTYNKELLSCNYIADRMIRETWYRLECHHYFRQKL